MDGRDADSSLFRNGSITAFRTDGAGGQYRRLHAADNPG